jgi:hypothetical protein
LPGSPPEFSSQTQRPLGPLFLNSCRSSVQQLPPDSPDILFLSLPSIFALLSRHWRHFDGCSYSDYGIDFNPPYGKINSGRG